MLVKSRKRAVLGIACAVAVSSQAYAIGIEEVIVTAQKRAQSLQEVPVAITAIDAETLDNLNLTNASGLVQASSSLTFEDGAGNGAISGAFRIRGVGTSLFDANAEPAVAVLIDGVSLVNTSLALAALSDLERVEVLRGPQTTLYGKSASAGLINIVTKAPSEEFEAEIEAQLIEDEQKYLAGVSGPISDSLSYRVSGFWHELDPLGKNLATGNNVYSFTSKGGRAKLFWQPVESFDATLSMHYAKSENDQSSSTRLANYPLFLFGPPPAGLPTEDAGVIPSPHNRNIADQFDPRTRIEYYGASLTANWELGGHELVSITAFDNYTMGWTVNLFNLVPLPLLPFPPFFIDGDLNDQRDVETQLISQEFRLVSPVGERFDYVLGFYAAKATVDEDLLRESQLLTTISFDRSADTSSETTALFGQFNYQITDRVNLSVGARINYEKIGIDYKYRAPVSVVFEDDDSEPKWLGKVALQYFLDDDNKTMLYGSVATGYKGQAYDVSSVTPERGLDVPVKAETSLAYELGLKTTLLDNRLQLNAALFHTDYDDYQAQAIVLEGGVLVAKVDNVGQLRTRGVEVDAVALFTENLRLTTSLAYTEAQIKEFDRANCYPGQTPAQGCVGGFQDLAGKDLSNSPDLKVTMALDYDLPLTELPFDGFFHMDYAWQDEVQYSLSGNPNTIEGSYGIANVNLGIRDRDGAYQITVFVNNAFDKQYAATLGDASGLFPGQGLVLNHTLARNFERYAGVKLKVAF